jgi:hypothetical protein
VWLSEYVRVAAKSGHGLPFLHPGGDEEGDHMAHQDSHQRQALEML